jgi:hypothetical protein
MAKRPMGTTALLESIEAESQAAVDRVVDSIARQKQQAMKRNQQHQRFWGARHAETRRKGLEEHLSTDLKLRSSPFAPPLR